MTEPLPQLPPPEIRRNHRKAMGLTRQEVADDLGISTRQLLRWENGATPSPLNRRRYARLLTEWQEKILA